jgi:hypothetical protein
MLSDRIKSEGISVLFSGAVASSAATFVGHYPWFAAYNTLSEALPTYSDLLASIQAIQEGDPGQTELTIHFAFTLIIYLTHCFHASDVPEP